MDTSTSADAPATAWARTRGRVRGVSWETLEAHLLADHTDIQLLLRIRGRALPRQGVWYLTAFAAAAAAGLVAFGLRPFRPEAALVLAGLLMLVATACGITGYIGAWKGYGTNADALWGGLLLFVSMITIMGIGLLGTDLQEGMGGLADLVFWSAFPTALVGFTGLDASTLTPGRGGARPQRAIAAAAALPEPERRRLRADLTAALDVLVARKVIGATTRKKALAAPLGGLAASFVNESSS